MACLFLRSNGIHYIALKDINGERRWISTGSRDRAEAEIIAEPIIQKYENPRIFTLQALQQKVCQYAQTNLSPSTVSVYNRSFQKLIKSVGNIVIKAVTPLLMEKFKEDCLKEISAVTANIYIRTIRAAFRLAVEWRLIELNPAKSCKLIRVPQKEPVFLTRKDIDTLFKNISDPIFRSLIIFALCSGMRVGELCNLRWEDLDFENRIIRIRNRDLFSVKGGHPRTIPMHIFIYREFNSLKHNSGHIFLNTKGLPQSPKNAGRRFKIYVRKSGLSDEVHFHSLRHTCASLLLQEKTPIYEVQKLLGHKSISTTQIYAHLENEHLRQSLDRLDLSKQYAGLR
jgi:integrase/recombinase XerC